MRTPATTSSPCFDTAALKAATPLGKGLGASPGAACGKVVFTAEDAEAWAGRGEKVVLVRLETSPEDITGMKVAQFVHKITCDLESSLSGSLTVAALQHVELLVLHRELHILHVMIVVFKHLADLDKLCVSFREKVVLVRLETSPEDITGMKVAQGILTVRGGMTSHAAVVARGMGTCCVSGCGDIAMDEENKKFTLAGKEFHEGDFVSIDGTTGREAPRPLPSGVAAFNAAVSNCG